LLLSLNCYSTSTVTQPQLLLNLNCYSTSIVTQPQFLLNLNCYSTSFVTEDHLKPMYVVLGSCIEIAIVSYICKSTKKCKKLSLVHSFTCILRIRLTRICLFSFLPKSIMDSFNRKKSFLPISSLHRVVFHRLQTLTYLDHWNGKFVH
jgi:hypothetical protein